MSIALLAPLAGCARDTATEAARPDAEAQGPSAQEAGSEADSGGMVAAANPLAVEAGLEILREGGSAADAAVAVQAALGLVEPQSSGLGGGAFLVYLDAETGDVTAYDGRETAPSGAGPELFFDSAGDPLPFGEARTAGRAAGVPGVVAMLDLAQAEQGRLPWSLLFDGAIALAEDGFPVSPRMSASIAQGAQFGALDERPATRAYFFTADGAPLPAGHILKNPDYAQTLRTIAEQGAGAFYTGAIAQAIVDSVQEEKLPGALTLEDIVAYDPGRAPAVCGPYRIWLVCSAPPPSSGGVIINETLGMLARFDLAALGPDSAEAWHVIIDALRLAYADRDLYVADPDFTEVPTGGLLDPAYIAARAALIEDARAIPQALAGTPLGAPVRGADVTQEVPGTSHFVVVDRWGDVASMTTSVEAAFGSQRMAAGFLLNNQMTDFAREAYAPDGTLLANAPEGGKRPRSSMSPVIVLDRQTGEFVLAVGSPGGNAIPSYVVKALVGMLDWSLSPQDAVDLPNVVARGDRTQIETGFDPALTEALRGMGHDIVESRGENSGLHAVRALPDGTLIGGADSRREGEARAP